MPGENQRKVRRKPLKPRRFEPRFGVSQSMLEHEARYVGREVEDYCLLSLNDLRKKLVDRRSAWKRANDELEEKLHHFNERELAAVQCLIVRDCHHLLELYLAYLKSRLSSGAVPDRIAPMLTREEDAPQLPFSEWLFG